MASGASALAQVRCPLADSRAAVRRRCGRPAVRQSTSISSSSTHHGAGHFNLDNGDSTSQLLFAGPRFPGAPRPLPLRSNFAANRRPAPPVRGDRLAKSIDRIAVVGCAWSALRPDNRRLRRGLVGGRPLGGVLASGTVAFFRIAARVVQFDQMFFCAISQWRNRRAPAGPPCKDDMPNASGLYEHEHKNAPGVRPHHEPGAHCWGPFMTPSKQDGRLLPSVPWADGRALAFGLYGPRGKASQHFCESSSDLSTGPRDRSWSISSPAGERPLPVPPSETYLPRREQKSGGIRRGRMCAPPRPARDDRQRPQECPSAVRKAPNAQ